MGYTSALGMAESTDLDTALAWHLGSNHFPPVTLTMIEPCKAAIEAALDDEPRRLIDLPDGVTYKDQPYAPAFALIEAHHLDAFIEVESW